MGVVKKILGIKEVDPVSTFYSGYGAIEIAESIHLHWRNARIEFDDREFEIFCRMAVKSYLRWLNLGKVGNVPPGEMIFLSKIQMDEKPSALNPAISSNEIRLEVQQWADYIHFHWKWLRLELSFDEFVGLAELMAQSLERFKGEDWFDHAPRRIGKNHRAVPFGRVNEKPSKDFWVNREDAYSWIGHESYYLDDEDNLLKQAFGGSRKGPLDGRARGLRVRAWRELVDRETAKELIKLFIPNWLLGCYRWVRASAFKS